MLLKYRRSTKYPNNMEAYVYKQTKLADVVSSAAC